MNRELAESLVFRVLDIALWLLEVPLYQWIALVAVFLFCVSLAERWKAEERGRRRSRGARGRAN